MRLASVAEADAWGALEAESIVAQVPGQSAFSIALSQEAGYLLTHPIFGHYLVRQDGLEVLCAPSLATPWKWQRFLIGQLLPLVAVLRRLEVLHASAIGVGGKAVVLLGASGGGKTSLALELYGRGAEFMSDDVSAVGLDGAGIVVHPGASLVSFDAHQRGPLEARLGPDRLQLLGEWNGEARATVSRAPDALPLEHVLVLVPSTRGSAIEIEPIRGGGLPILLGATFIAYLQGRDRLQRQLDICARILASVPVSRVVAPRPLGMVRLADAVAAQVGLT